MSYNTNTTSNIMYPATSTPTYTTTPSGDLRVAQEQQMAVNAGHHAKEKLHQIATNPHMPSNASVSNYIDKTDQTLFQIQQSGRAQQMGPNGQQIIDDARRLLADERNMLARKNEGDALQNIIRHTKGLGHAGQSQGGEAEASLLKQLFKDWKNIISSITGGSEAQEIFHAGNDLLMSLGDTEEFLDLVSELITYAKLLVLSTEAKINHTEKDSSTLAKEQNARKEEREVLMDKLRATLNTLASNELWNHMMQQGRALASKASQAGSAGLQETQQTMQAVAPQAQAGVWQALESPQVRALTEDLKMFLQKLVGDDYDVTPLFEYTKAAVRDIAHDPELHKIVHEAGDTLQHITMNEAGSEDPTIHAANPAYASLNNSTNNNNAGLPLPSLSKDNIGVPQHPQLHGVPQHPHGVPQTSLSKDNTPQTSLAKHTGGLHAHDQEVEEQLQSVANHLEVALNNIKNNQNLRRAKQEAHILREAFMNDPNNLQLIADAKQLWRDLHAPSGGLDPAFLHGLRDTIVPIFLDHLNNIPVPPIHDTVSMLGKMAYSIEGIRVSVPEVLPENLHVKFEYEMDTTLTKLQVSNHHTYMCLEAKNIHLHLRNVAWAYQRLSHPRRRDSGHLDLDTVGTGIGIRLRAQIHNDQTVEIKEVHVMIDKFHVRIVDSRHNHLYQGLAHIFARQVKKQVERSLETKLKEIGAKVGGKVVHSLMEVKSKSHGLYTASMGKKTQVFEMLHARRAQHGDKGNMKERAAHLRENSLVQSAVHKAAEAAIGNLDAQQHKVEEKKEQVHQEAELRKVEEGATKLGNRPSSPPVPSALFVQAGAPVDTTPITTGLNHVPAGSLPDTTPITTGLHHVPDPLVQKQQQALEQQFAQTRI